MAGYIGSKAVNLSTTGADINGDANIDGTVTADAYALDSIALPSAGTATIFNRNTDNNLYIQTDSGNTVYLLDGSQNTMYAVSPTSHIFQISNAEKMRIDSSGNVGIGTSSPYKSLTVGSTDASAWITSGGSNVHLTVSPNGASGSFIVRTGGTNGDPSTTTERMRITSSGSVGIGTSSPATPLHIVTSGNTAATFHSTTDNSNLVFTDASTTANVAIGAVSGDNFRVQIANAERMRIDSSGNVGIGVVTPTERLDIQTTAGRFKVKALGGSSVELESNSAVKLKAAANDVILDGASNIIFDIADTEKMRIDSSGNVGIGQAPTAFSNWKVLELKGGTEGAMLNFENSASTRVSTVAYDDSIDALRIQTFLANPIRFETNNAERMRIDSSGNLLVGKTSGPNYNVVGVDLTALGEGQFTVSSNPVLQLNRQSTDGDIAVFRKDGSTVGSIASIGGTDLGIGSGAVGLRFRDATSDTIRPSNVSTGNDVDGTIDLGASTARFKDLYLSGGVYLGGVGAANKLDDYEEGTFTATLGFRTSATGSLNYTRNTFRYIKVGGSVFITGFLTWSQNNFTASSGSMQLQGLPFTFANTQLYRGGVNVVYSDAAFSGVTIYQQGFRNEQAETNMIFNFSDTTNGAMDSTITNYTSIPSSGGMMITGTYTTL